MTNADLDRRRERIVQRSIHLERQAERKAFRAIRGGLGVASEAATRPRDPDFEAQVLRTQVQWRSAVVEPFWRGRW